MAEAKSTLKTAHYRTLGYGVIALFVLALLAFFLYTAEAQSIVFVSGAAEVGSSTPPWPLPLDKEAYDARMLRLAHIGSSTISALLSLQSPTSTLSISGSIMRLLSTSTRKDPPWPVAQVYPEGGALLPFNRIVAYYGNFYSTQMGVLGEYPPEEVLQKLQDAAAQWAAADPSTPVIPAVDYIAVTAQASAGPDGKYRLRMPASQIEKALSMANEIHGLLFLDVQVGLSTVQMEIPLLKQFLMLPNVELSIDPEFSMKDGVPPGREIGTFDATDVDYTAGYLAQLVNEYKLPPKILVVHRFTEDMVTHYRSITPLPQVEVVMDMDGWGSQQKKIGTYTYFIAGEPVQFTGFKLFYKNDIRPPSTGLLSPQQVLSLTPAPSFIQYQ